MRKNLCLNNLKNTILINRGLYTEEKICDYYTVKDNVGDGMVLCNESKVSTTTKEFWKTGKIILTKLSNYLHYLSTKKIGLIKLDVEGAEEKVIKSGIELIKEIHVPFITAEYNQKLFKEQDTNPSEFIKLFLDNGYKMSDSGFFPTEYRSLEYILRKNGLFNLFFVHKDFISKNKM